MGIENLGSGIDLLNADLLHDRGCSLRHDNRQDAVLQTGADGILVDALGEVERAVELADRALGDPVLVGWRSGLGDLLGGGLGGLGDGGCRLLTLDFVFDGSLVRGGAGAAGSFLFSGFGFFSVGSVVLALDLALDDQGLRVGELDLDVLLVDAREFTVKVVRVLDFSHVEARRKSADGSGRWAGLRGAVDIVVVKKTEEGGEVGSEVETWEESHCSGWTVGAFVGSERVAGNGCWDFSESRSRCFREHKVIEELLVAFAVAVLDG